jgi:hypothetical protein
MEEREKVAPVQRLIKKKKCLLQKVRRIQVGIKSFACLEE